MGPLWGVGCGTGRIVYRLTHYSVNPGALWICDTQPPWWNFLRFGSSQQPVVWIWDWRPVCFQFWIDPPPQLAQMPSAFAIFTCRPNSHPFQERHVYLDEPVKIGRSVARCRPAQNNATFDCKVLSRNHALVWFDHKTGKVIMGICFGDGLLEICIIFIRSADDFRQLSLFWWQYILAVCRSQTPFLVFGQERFYFLKMEMYVLVWSYRFTPPAASTDHTGGLEYKY